MSDIRPPNYITPAGYSALRAEYDQLLGEERPRIVEIVSWAAGNGDRSENGDYLYGRKRMREIDRRLKWLAQRMKAAKGIEASEIPPDSLTKTSSIADAYWFTHQQSRDGWTHELDLRPSVETW